MGSNEFPPPPPPGQPPSRPNPPSYTPPAQYPPTQPNPVYPPQGYPQPAYVPVGAPAPKKKNTGLIVGGLVGAAAIIGGIVAFSGGDDKKTGLPIGTTQDSVIATDTPTSVVVETTDDEIVITEPTQPWATTTTIVSGVQSVTDDTKTFKVTVPKAFETDTTSVKFGDVTLASISGSADLDDYYKSHDRFGVSMFVAGASLNWTVEQMVGYLETEVGEVEDCGPKHSEIGRPTKVGPVTMSSFDGCGKEGESGKVMMVIKNSRGAVIAMYVQGTSPASGTLLSFGQAVLESVGAP